MKKSLLPNMRQIADLTLLQHMLNDCLSESYRAFDYYIVFFDEKLLLA